MFDALATFFIQIKRGAFAQTKRSKIERVRLRFSLNDVFQQFEPFHKEAINLSVFETLVRFMFPFYPNFFDCYASHVSLLLFQ